MPCCVTFWNNMGEKNSCSFTSNDCELLFLLEINRVESSQIKAIQSSATRNAVNQLFCSFVCSCAISNQTCNQLVDCVKALPALHPFIPSLSTLCSVFVSLCHLEVLYYKLSFTFLPSSSLSAIFFSCFSSDSRIVPQATNCHSLSLLTSLYLSLIQASCIRCRMMKTCTIPPSSLCTTCSVSPHTISIQHDAIHWEGQVQYQFSQTENV